MSSEAALPTAARTAPVSGLKLYPVRYDVEPQRRHGRLSVLFRPLLALPYAIVAGAIAYLVYPLTVLAWFAIVFAGRYPRGLWGFCANLMIWRARLYTYAGLLRDEYPPFGYGPYPAIIQIDYADRRSRVRTIFRSLLMLPQLFATYFIYIAWYACLLLAWVATLITGSYPEGIRRFMVGATRWLLRLEAYILLLVDEYPPFTLGLDEPPLSTEPPAGPGGSLPRTGIIARGDGYEAEHALQSAGAAVEGLEAESRAPALHVERSEEPFEGVPGPRADEPAAASGPPDQAGFHTFPARSLDDVRRPPTPPPE